MPAQQKNVGVQRICKRARVARVVLSLSLSQILTFNEKKYAK